MFAASAAPIAVAPGPSISPNLMFNSTPALLATPTSSNAVLPPTSTNSSSTSSAGTFISILPRIYSQVNTDSSSTNRCDYETFQPKWNSSEGYEILCKLGRGKYSEVFEGVKVLERNATISREMSVVIKVLKPVKKKKIRREILILSLLRDGPNIIQLIDTVRSPDAIHCSLVFEFIHSRGHTDFKSLYPTFSDNDIRHYVFELIKAIDFSHSRGIFHRDIKPHNVMIDPQKRELRLIDWGLAEFYFPNKEYNVRVASRYFKGPELLLNYRRYDYSLDMWSLGAMFAGMIFLIHPFFHGKDNNDQLLQIVKVLGSASLDAYLQKYNMDVEDDSLRKQLTQMRSSYRKLPWTRWVQPRNRHLISAEALDLLDKLLRFDHAERINTAEALQHPYFDPIRNSKKDAVPAPGLALKVNQPHMTTVSSSIIAMINNANLTNGTNPAQTSISAAMNVATAGSSSTITNHLNSPLSINASAPLITINSQTNGSSPNAHSMAISPIGPTASAATAFPQSSPSALASASSASNSSLARRHRSDNVMQISASASTASSASFGSLPTITVMPDDANGMIIDEPHQPQQQQPRRSLREKEKSEKKQRRSVSSQDLDIRK